MARILIIDDTKNIRKMVELTLKSSGHETQTADDGEAGLQLFGDGANWDLTIVDQQMPKIEGREFIQQARERDSSTRIIMMTAFATSDLASEIMQLGALDFLRKPFSTETLRGAVEAALSHEKEIVAPLLATENESESPTKFTMPRVAYRFNGFSFWPLPQSSTRSAPGLSHGVTFQVRDPSGKLSQCFVGVTQHIQQEIERELGEQVSSDANFWEDLCGTALSEFFLKNSQLPPVVLPVIDVPKRLLEQNRSPVSWGFYTQGR